jgi:hypothetical protein
MIKRPSTRWGRALGARCLAASVLVAGAAAAPAFDDPLILSPKQLHAPASDFLPGGPLVPADFTESGQRSRSAMIPMTFKEVEGEWVWEKNVPIDSWDGEAIMYFAGPDSVNWDIQFQAPGEAPMDRSALAARSNTVRDVRPLDVFGVNVPALEAFKTRSATAGVWRVEAKTRSFHRSAQGAHPDGYFVMAVESPYRLYTHVVGRDLMVGNRMEIRAHMFDNNERAARGGDSDCATSGVRDAAVMVTNAISRIKATVYRPDSSSVVIALFDDGRHNDDAAGDGLFAGSMLLEQAGDHLIHIEAEGRLPNGLNFIRTTTDIAPAVERKVELASSAAIARPETDLTLRVDLPIREIAATEKVQMLGEVWGHDAQGAELPVCWLGCMARPFDNENGERVVSYRLDTRWIDYTGAQGPFELRNVRVQDPDTFVPFIRAERLPLNIQAMPARAGSAPVTEISWDMIEGSVPAEHHIPVSAPVREFWRQHLEKMEQSEREDGTNYLQLERGSHSLMMVHGYCSGDVWNNVTGDWPENVNATFTENKTIFTDYSANRTHDQFAQMVRAVGINLKSFGIVAHSQGGCASAQLLTYYYSGLHWARGGSRLIQSVGTPYQGTSLAGNLAAIGSVFGVGCGTNNNLTYSGGDAFLPTIPSAQRGFIWPYTAEYAEITIFNDYCSVATDGFLDDPEDGTTEHRCGQLPGSHQQALTKGQCHTASMADPPEYGTKRRTDDNVIVTHNRNATMSSLAKR